MNLSEIYFVFIVSRSVFQMSPKEKYQQLRDQVTLEFKQFKPVNTKAYKGKLFFRCLRIYLPLLLISYVPLLVSLTSIGNLIRHHDIYSNDWGYLPVSIISVVFAFAFTMNFFDDVDQIFTLFELA